MAKKNGGSTALAEVTPVEQLPDYLRATAPVGLESKGESTVTPRIKVVQAMSDEEIVEEFGAGAILIGDKQTMLCPPDGSFVGVPVYSFPSFEVWKDVNDKSSDNPVEQLSLDSKSDIAAKAKARHSEPYGNNFKRSWVESLNFIIELADGQVAMLSYSKGSAKIGRRFKGYMQRTGADIFAHRIEFYPDTLRNAKGRWFTVNFRPAKPAWVSKEDHARLSKLYAELDRGYKAGSIAVAQPHSEPGEDVDEVTGEVG